jgi:hypothetical protein
MSQILKTEEQPTRKAFLHERPSLSGWSDCEMDVKLTDNLEVMRDILMRIPTECGGKFRHFGAVILYDEIVISELVLG